MLCQDVMTPQPVCCDPKDSVQRAAEIMKDLNIGAVPVCDASKRLAGIVTDRDLTLKILAEGRDPKTVLVDDVMTREVFACQPEDKIDRVFELMERQQVRRVPIVDPRQGLVGIIAQADLATRLRAPAKTAEVVTEISRPSAVAA
ncbi:MAG TPA: CBS domain-containing protein [Bryobacteraceae bacterium]|nr:CBS domain-containing protein [Bryobacteraceae bacterium]